MATCTKPSKPRYCTGTTVLRRQRPYGTYCTDVQPRGRVQHIVVPVATVVADCLRAVKPAVRTGISAAEHYGSRFMPTIWKVFPRGDPPQHAVAHIVFDDRRRCTAYQKVEATRRTSGTESFALIGERDSGLL